MLVEPAFDLAAPVAQRVADSGGRQFLKDWRGQLREVLGELRRWPAETRRDLHAAWHAGDADERERMQRQAVQRRPLAVYHNRQRNTVLCAAFGLVTVFAAVAAVTSRPSTNATLGFGLFALLMLYVCIRVAVMKAVATPKA